MKNDGMQGGKSDDIIVFSGLVTGICLYRMSSDTERTEYYQRDILCKKCRKERKDLS